MFTQIDHIGIFVKDLESGMELYERTFGLKVQQVEVHENLGIKLCFIPLGEVMVELIQPIREDCNSARILKEKGPCIGHIAYRVKDIRKALSSLKEKGVKLKDEEPRPGGGGSQIAFLDSESTDGITIELVERDGW